MKKQTFCKTPLPQVCLQVIGYVKGGFDKKAHAPKQGLKGQRSKESLNHFHIKLLSHYNFEQALEGLDGFDYVWVLYHMDQAGYSRAKIRVPGTAKKEGGSIKKQGVFATRSPHRPSPIGLTLCKFISVKDRKLTLEGCDMLEGTPVLDIKPYLSSIESKPGAKEGWIKERQENLFEVCFSPAFEKDLEELKTDPYLQKEVIHRALCYGPYPSGYNRVKKVRDSEDSEATYILSLGPWRVLLSCESYTLTALKLFSGYEHPELLENLQERKLHLRFKK